jgi:2-keto-3-deoxy-6-phosphogluconate aldolase
MVKVKTMITGGVGEEEIGNSFQLPVTSCQTEGEIIDAAQFFSGFPLSRE